MKAFATIIAIVLSAEFALAQPPPAIRTTRQEVLIYVIVRDKQGKAVRDLTAAGHTLPGRTESSR